MIVITDSILKVTGEEYKALQVFLAPLGVELRAIAYSGATNTYEIQSRNALRDICKLCPDRSAGWALEESKKEIQEGLWCR